MPKSVPVNGTPPILSKFVVVVVEAKRNTPTYRREGSRFPSADHGGPAAAPPFHPGGFPGGFPASLAKRRGCRHLPIPIRARAVRDPIADERPDCLKRLTIGWR